MPKSEISEIPIWGTVLFQSTKFYLNTVGPSVGNCELFAFSGERFKNRDLNSVLYR